MAQKKPNILHIFTDQQRFDTIAALGNPIIKTPALDRLVREGTAFTSAYSPSPVCVPARCSMIYGQYPARTGSFENDTMLTDDRQSFMDVLRQQGYHTYGVGKCHFVPDPHALRGFDSRERQEEYIGDPRQDEYIEYLHENGYGHLPEPHGMREELYYVPQISPLPTRHHPSQWVGDRSVAFLDSHANDSQPWYLYAGFIAPHPPLNPPAPWYRLYAPILMDEPFVPDNSPDHMTWISRFQNRYKCRDGGYDRHLVKAMRAFYYASISFVDYQIGRILDKLEAMGELDNTLIIFAADHGEYLGDYGCFGKRHMHDVSARVPLLCRYPQSFAANTRCDRVASLVDIAQTAVTAAGGAFSSHACEGVDLGALARGGVDRRYVVSQYSHGDSAIYMTVTDTWKYIYSAADRKEFLFDRIRDRREQYNRAGLIHFREVVTDMKRQTIDYLRSAGHTEGIDGDTWRTYETITLKDEWKWWPMKPPAQFEQNRDSSLLQNPARRIDVPPAYTSPDAFAEDGPYRFFKP